MSEPVVSDAAAKAIALSVEKAATAITAAISGHAATMNLTLGANSTNFPDSLPSVAQASASNLGYIHSAIQAQTEQIVNLTVAVGKISNSLDILTKAAGTMAYTSIQSLNTQQLAYADQVKNNKFNQKTTNAALERANLPPTEVQPEEFKKEVADRVVDLGTIKAQNAAVDVIQSTVTEYTKAGFEMATKWVAESAFGKWVQDYYAEAKVQVQLLYADEKTKAKLEEQLRKMKEAKKMPSNG